MRVGQVDYINPLPLFVGLEGFELVPDTPANLNAALASGDLDVSLVSSFEYIRNRHLYTLVPGLCVAADGPVMSVNLYVGDELPTLDGANLALTPESAASAQLVRILCRDFWGVTPTYVDWDADRDAFLLIGDEALRNRTIPGYRTIDLAHAWREATGYPMVFALFASRIDSPELVEALHATLKANLADNFNAVIAIAIERTGLPEPLLRDYFAGLTYTLGDREMRGLETYTSHCP